MNTQKIKQVLIILCLLLMVCLPVMAQRDYLHIPRQSAINTASYGVFDSEYDTFDDPLYWMENKPDVYAIYNGITEDNYLLGFARQFEDVYFQGAYFGLFPTYGSWWTMLTNFDLNFLLGFNDMWSFKFQYFDQNYNTGQGSVLPEFIGGLKLPINDSILRTSFSFAPAFHWSGGLQLDYIQPEFILEAEYTSPNKHIFGLIQSVMLSFDSPGPHNVTPATGAPVRYQTTLWYHKDWSIDDIVKVGIEPTVQFQFNPIDFPLKGKTYDGVTIPMEDAGNFYIAIPTALTMDVVPEKISVHTGLILGMFYADYDYVAESSSGGNFYGWIPISGFGLGASIKVSDRVHFQIGSQLTFVPQIVEGTQPTYYDKELSLANFASEPIEISIRVGK